MLCALTGRAVAEGPIAIAAVKHEGPVSFEKEILPLLVKNCVACHNAKKAENSLVLETPQSILKGGDNGPAVVAGKSAESLLLKAASHAEEPMMPPADNGVGAVALTGEQLGLVKLWIDEGATGTIAGAAPLKWQPLPPGVNPIYAVAMTADGQYGACGRANQVFVYNLASGQLATRLTDAELVKRGLYQHGVAHLDLVQSLAFSPDGSLLASGGYREVKLWRRPRDVHRADFAGVAAAVQSLATSADGKWAATGAASGAIQLWNLSAPRDPKLISGHTAAVTGLLFTADGSKLVSASLDKTLRAWNTSDGAAAGQIETPAPINALVRLADGRVASGGADNIVRLWTLGGDAAAAFAAAAQLPPHAQPITALAASPAETAPLVSASADGVVRIWNLATAQPLGEINHGAAVTAVAARVDGKQIATAGADHQIKLWNAADRPPNRRLAAAPPGSVCCARCDHDRAAPPARGTPRRAR